MAGRGFFPSVKGEFGKAECDGTSEERGNDCVPPYWSSPQGEQREGREGGPGAACRRRLRSIALAQEGLLRLLPLGPAPEGARHLWTIKHKWLPRAQAIVSKRGV